MNIINKIIFKRHKFSSLGKMKYVGKRIKVLAPQYIKIGKNFTIGDNCYLQTWPEYLGKKNNYIPELTIGDNVSMMSNCHISCMNKVMIGNGCLLGDNVYITDNFHGNNKLEEKDVIPIDRPLSSKGPVIIGKNVWIGRNVCIMPGVIIGDNVIIGANSVVTSSVNSYTIVAGNPAKTIKDIE